MAYELRSKGIFDRQGFKKPTSTSIDYEPPVPIPKRLRTKVQCSKEFVDEVLSKKAKRSFATCSSSLPVLCSKVIHLLPEDSLQKYKDKFLYKHVDPEYFVDSTAEIELKTNFLKPFVNHHLLKFIGMKRKHNPDCVKAFYCNLEITHAGLKNSDYDKFSFVMSISKVVCKNMEMSNSQINQVKFDMRLLHLIVVKILARKPRNSSRVDDRDLYLMWSLTHGVETIGLGSSLIGLSIA
ncbi:hypothetical protein KIW84_045771 [Lathyrus oleraceus]|uniref:Uncharacterized protein n=1 Tax=Pisum sativum TaxID=3888 RepID=A0A9D5AXM3_PEA|nr:hypothetical protein KIW84_045771 [Pisum sativum]